MVEFLTRKKTASEVEAIIKNAEREIVLISPYLQLSDDLVAGLKDRDKRSVDIKIIYTDEDLKPDQRRKLEDEKKRLQQLRNLTLKCLKHLHAKCYYNENRMVITSMNLYDYSERNNWEMGLLIQREQDEDAFNAAKKEAKLIIDSADTVKSRSSFLEEFSKGVESVVNSLVQDESKGHCIHCRADIPYNEREPYCPSCYAIWKNYRNRAYKEKVCHECGKPAKTSMAKPLCASCYGKS